MRKSIFLSVVISFLMFVGGCKKTLDTSSEAAFKTSAEEISKTLPPEKASAFEDAIGTIMMKEVVLAPGVRDPGSMQKKLAEVFGGKGVDDIIADAEKIKAQNKAEIDKMMKN